MLDDLLAHPVLADTDDAPAQSPPPPFTRSTNWRSMAAGPSRTTPTRGPCPSRTSPKARSPAPSMPSPICSAAPGSRTTCPTCSGRFVNLFHRKADRITRDLDDNEQAQRRSQAEQDGSEVQVGRPGAPDRPGAHAHRAPQRLRVPARPRRRALRGPHRLRLATPVRVDGQPPHADGGGDRLPRLPQRQAPGRDRGPSPARSAHRLRGRGRLQRPRPDLGGPRPGAREAPGDGPAARRHAQGRRAHRRLLGRQPARCRRSPSSPTGPGTRRRLRSSATTRCSRPCRSGSSSSRAPASPRTWPTRPARSASRSSASRRRTAPLRRGVSACG